MPHWIHNRAEHILAKNPSMSKSTAFAIATQQSHSMGKSPKGYGTSEGKDAAKAKYSNPKDYKKRSNPGNLESKKMAALEDDIRKALEGKTDLNSLVSKETKAIANTGTPGRYLKDKAIKILPEELSSHIAKIGNAQFNAMVDEILNKISSGEVAQTRLGNFIHGAKHEAGPAIGATLGAGVAKAYGVDPLAGAAAGYGLGALPDIISSIRSRGVKLGMADKEPKTDDELKEIGRQRGVTNLAAEATRDKGRRGERFGEAAGRALGALGGAAAGNRLLGGRAGAITGLAGGLFAGGRIGKELGTEADIKKNASGEITYPEDHSPVTADARGGTSCANCKFAQMMENGPHCNNPYYQQYMGTSELIDPESGERVLDPKNYCSDWWDRKEEQPKKEAFRNSAYAGNIAQNPPGMKSHSALPSFNKPSLQTKQAGMGIGASMTTSQYSGPLSYGPFKMTSGIPPFTAPPASRVDPKAGGPEGWMMGANKHAAAIAALTAGTTPAGRLRASQSVGAPKVTAPSGPSIAAVAKPQGFGTPLAGATKSVGEVKQSL